MTPCCPVRRQKCSCLWKKSLRVVGIDAGVSLQKISNRHRKFSFFLFRCPRQRTDAAFRLPRESAGHTKTPAVPQAQRASKKRGTTSVYSALTGAASTGTDMPCWNNGQQPTQPWQPAARACVQCATHRGYSSCPATRLAPPGGSLHGFWDRTTCLRSSSFFFNLNG